MKDIELSWDAVTTRVPSGDPVTPSYRVEMSTDPAAGWTAFPNLVADTGFLVVDLEPSTYHFRVTAVDEANDLEGVPSDTLVMTITVDPPAQVQNLAGQIV
jgi:hypothetical protein